MSFRFSLLATLYLSFRFFLPVTPLRNLFSCRFWGKSRGKPIVTFLLTGQKKTVYCFLQEKAGETHLTFFLSNEKEKPFVHFLLAGQKKVNRKHALRQSRREKPSALLYRPIITPQHLWLECYFFFVYSNKEKVTKKACPEQGRWETNCYLSFVRAKER